MVHLNTICRSMYSFKGPPVMVMNTPVDINIWHCNFRSSSNLWRCLLMQISCVATNWDAHLNSCWCLCSSFKYVTSISICIKAHCVLKFRALTWLFLENTSCVCIIKAQEFPSLSTILGQVKAKWFLFSTSVWECWRLKWQLTKVFNQRYSKELLLCSLQLCPPFTTIVDPRMGPLPCRLELIPHSK
jgi:hypothetical protein